jgi:hypothetical protein
MKYRSHSGAVAYCVVLGVDEKNEVWKHEKGIGVDGKEEE